MSQTWSVRTSTIKNPHFQDGTDEFAKQASGVSLDLIEAGDVLMNPVTPALTQGHIIMPPLHNETIKYWGLDVSCFADFVCL